MPDLAYELLEKSSTPKASSVFKVLRVAIAIGSGVSCFILLILWARSYTYRDRIVLPFSATRCLCVNSQFGKLEFETYGPGMGPWELSLSSLSHSAISAAWRANFIALGPEPENREKWRWKRTHTGRLQVYIPHLLPVTLVAIAAAGPWLVTRRFSLRTLLIATTLVAVVLGLAVWAAR